MPKAEGNDQRGRCIQRQPHKEQSIEYCDGPRVGQMTAQGTPQFYSGTSGYCKQKYLAQFFDHGPMWLLGVPATVVVEIGCLSVP
jgi:hypothetical protein